MNMMRPFADPMEYFSDHAPKRVVSLVPSTTGSLIDLGLSGCLAGVTDYCPIVETAARVGGPKTPDVDKIRSLKPDLVLVNQEENSKETVEAICAAGIAVWLTFPNTVQAMLADLWVTASLFRSDLAMERVQSLEVGIEWAELAAQDQNGMRYFCPIWQGELESGERWWMSFNAQTYSNDVLRLVGGQNIFSGRPRKYPIEAEIGSDVEEEAGVRDTRYPRVGLAEILQAQPEVILLPDEPYAFDDRHLEEISQLFASTPAVKAGRIFTFDGSLINWPGTRIARALAELPQFFLY